MLNGRPRVRFRTRSYALSSKTTARVRCSQCEMSSRVDAPRRHRASSEARHLDMKATGVPALEVDHSEIYCCLAFPLAGLFEEMH